MAESREGLKRDGHGCTDSGIEMCMFGLRNPHRDLHPEMCLPPMCCAFQPVKRILYGRCLPVAPGSSSRGLMASDARRLASLTLCVVVALPICCGFYLPRSHGRNILFEFLVSVDRLQCGFPRWHLSLALALTLSRGSICL